MRKLILSTTLLFSAVTCLAADPALNLQGTGTQTDPYILKDSTDVLTLARACNGATSSTSGKYKGLYFRQTADIDMNGVKGFHGIATAPADKKGSTSTWNFQGYYDGGGHRIKNMKIEGLVYKEDGSILSASANGSRSYVGFFGTLGEGATVSNLIIDGSCSIEAYNYAGGICGYTNSNVKITNCANFATVKVFDTYAGGIAGRYYASSSKPGECRNCFNAGTIIGYGTIGGICGQGDYIPIANNANVGSILCYNYYPGKTSVSSSKAGGIVGYSNYAKVSNCFNAGDVYASKENAGGIMGTAYASNTGGGSLVSCLNVGFVYSGLAYNSGNLVGAQGSSSATSQLTVIENCYYDAQLANTLFGGNNRAWQGIEGIKGYSTSKLTSGEKVTGLDTWVHKAGSFPIPSGLEYAELATAAKTYLTLPTGQDANMLTGTATASAGTTISLYRPTTLFTVAGNTVTAHPNLGNGNGVIVLNNSTFSRHILLSTYTIPFTGQGTETSPYLINNKEDLISFQNLTNNMQILWDGKYFRMTNDIDMAGETRFQGIGCTPDSISNLAPGYRLQFRGNFDGGNHKISNLVVEWVKFDADSNYIDWRKGGIYSNGFFGSLGNGAVVRNLTLDRSCKFKTYYYSGGIAAMARGAATIENCHVGAQIDAYYRYVGGIIGQDNSDAPVTINNCTFSGTLHGNYDYIGGIIGFCQNTKSVITNCVNTGSIIAEKFDTKVAGTNSTAQLNRIAGIAGAFRGKMTGCASYGPILVKAHPYDQSKNKMLGLGGLVGQVSCYGPETEMSYNFTSSQVYLTGSFNEQNVQAGSIAGDYYVQPKNIYGIMKANYVDTTLCWMGPIIGHNTPDTIANPASFHGLTTTDLTAGTPIDSLAQHFSFEAGYYPIPKAFATNADVRAAAATFMRINPGDGATIHSLKPGAICPFNTVMPLTGTLEKGSVFYVKDNALKQRNVDTTADDILTLTNGYFHTFYPVHKNQGMGVDTTSDNADIIVSTEYYTPVGIRITNPAPGSVVIAVSKTMSGRRIVTKTVIR